MKKKQLRWLLCESFFFFFLLSLLAQAAGPSFLTPLVRPIRCLFEFVFPATHLAAASARDVGLSLALSAARF